MSDASRNPKNVAGPFYVLKGQCISCDAPRAEAPGLVTLDEGLGCYFHKQPTAAAEVDDAIRAMFVSCVEAYRYGGTDPVIRLRLAELGRSHLCDHPLEGHPVALRNHVRFSLPEADRATDVARRLVAVFEATSRDGKCTTAVAGDAHRADFEYTHSAKLGTPRRRYTIDRVRAPIPTSSAYRDGSMAHAWLLVEDDGPGPPIWLREALIETGAADIRWFSRAEWNADAEGRELPY